MKKRITMMILFIGLNTIAQIKFEKGYIINNDGEKIDCLIKNEDWRHNPTNFIYKINNNSIDKKGNLLTIKEFGVYTISKYLRVKVNIDKSVTNVNRLSKSRLYDFKEETLFLKTLVEGNANLYVYNAGNFVKYFYNKEKSPIHQLEYKEYLNTKNLVAKNLNYLTQLKTNVYCENLDRKNIKYNKNSLVNYFLKYNNCDGNNNNKKNYTKTSSTNNFNLSFKLGLGNSTITSKNNLSSGSSPKSKDLNIRAGIEVAYVLPFNKNKWAVFIEPTYQSYKSNGFREIIYNSIELPLGLKHYLFLNDNSKLFFSGAYVLDFSFNSKIDFNASSNLKISSLTSQQLGFGYNYKSKYTVEARYDFGRNLTQDYVYWETNYSSFSIILGYSIF